MSDFNSEKNRVVWTDIPVADLARARRFYEAVLGVACPVETFEQFQFAVINHHDGNGGCLIPAPELVCEKGPLVYFNADGRIRDAVAKAAANGGAVIQDVHSIGPHGCRAVLRDSEGNRIALHSNTDA